MKKASERFQTIRNHNGPTLTNISRRILEEDGLYFKSTDEMWDDMSYFDEQDRYDLVIGNHYRIGTGFLSTYQVLNVLTDNGYTETAYRLLENEECPGWLYEVNRGATTIWEGWDAIDPVSGKIRGKSQNHYSPGAALSWLWTRCCGIRALEPGYTRIEIAPHPVGTLTWA